MNKQNNYTLGADTHIVTQWDRSGGTDNQTTSNDDTKKMGTDPQQEEDGDDNRKI